MSTLDDLESASQIRKARLARLKALQHKQGHREDGEKENVSVSRKRKSLSRSPSPASDVTKSILSGRNYDSGARGPKLGYQTTPRAGPATVEAQAQTFAEASKTQQELEAHQPDQTVDLFKLQPKKPTWDLKRHLDKKLEVVNARTDTAIARMVRERVQNAREHKGLDHDPARNSSNSIQGEPIGIEGAALVEATREMDREESRSDPEDTSEDDGG
ncbi:MAG: hypothetical protein Q9162_001875 [Coniocarpon cinnabarinum]